jgi:hypothetical protein
VQWRSRPSSQTPGWRSGAASDRPPICSPGSCASPVARRSGGTGRARAVGNDYREVWLIDPRTKALVSLGVIVRGGLSS